MQKHLTSVRWHVIILAAAYVLIMIGTLVSGDFMKMVLVMEACSLLLLFLYFGDITLALVSAAPPAFAMVATLHTMHILDQPLTVHGLMLVHVIFGAGIIYSVFSVGTCQRYGSDSNHCHALVRAGIFLAALINLTGLMAHFFTEQALITNAWMIIMMDTVYSLMGIILLLRPVLAFVFDPGRRRSDIDRCGGSPARRVLMRFRHLEAHPRLFARFKMILDPLFGEIVALVKKPSIILDIGCGYGIPAAWLLEHYPGVKILGIDPDPERCRIAGRILDINGTILVGKAPDLPVFADRADTAVMLDMIHYLSDREVTETLTRLRAGMTRNALLLIRATIPSPGRTPLLRRIESFQNAMRKRQQYFRSAESICDLLSRGGFRIDRTLPSGDGREEIWILSRKMR